MKATEETKLALEAVINGFPGLDAMHRRQILAAVRQEGQSKPRLLTTKEACAALEISRPTLQRWVRAGKLLQVRRSSRLIRYDAGQIEAIANGKAEIGREG